MRRRHLDDLDVVCDRCEIAQCLVDSLDELGREAGLHILELALKLINSFLRLHCNFIVFVTSTRLFLYLNNGLVYLRSHPRQVW